MIRTEHESGTRMIDNNCECHMMIDEVSVETNSGGASVKCKLSVLGSTDPAQVGKTCSEFFKCDGKGVGMFLNLSEAAGLITAQQRIAAKESGAGMEIDETQLKGRQICCKVKLERKQRKNPATGAYEDDPEHPTPYPRIGFDTFSVWDQKAAAIPKDQQFLAVWAQACPRPVGANGNGHQAQPAAAPVQQPASVPSQPAGQAVSMNW